MPIIRQGELDFISHSAEQTGRLGARLGQLLRAGDVVCLAGDMGAGKTVFASGIGKGWGTKYPVTSPTFNLVHTHRRDQDSSRLYHLDCYRLAHVDEVDGIGFDDIVDDPKGLLLVEWPERISEALPENRLWIEIRVIESTRRNLLLDGAGERHEQLVRQFREQTFGA